MAPADRTMPCSGEIESASRAADASAARELIEDTITNWSHDDPKVPFRILVGVAYGSDVEKVRALPLEVAREYPQTLADPAPVVCFSGFGESSLDFELGVWSEEMSYRPRCFRSDLNFAIERKLREAGIEIPFPQRDVHIRDAPPADAARGENPRPPEMPRAPR